MFRNKNVLHYGDKQLNKWQKKMTQPRQGAAELDTKV